MVILAYLYFGSTAGRWAMGIGSNCLDRYTHLTAGIGFLIAGPCYLFPCTVMKQIRSDISYGGYMMVYGVHG
jgi:hypothetical protein